MNRITPDALYRLLPAIHRLRDADEGQPLKALMAILAREGAVVEENIEQLLDNLFIETCADWAAPYIGGTIGYAALHPIEGADVGNRAEVANTIGYRRRKGTAAMLEQLARDVTGWPAHVIEHFKLTAACQHMNHIRPRHALAPDLRDPLTLEPLDRAFDTTSRAADMRSIQQSPGRRSIGGKRNFPNIGLHLWRLAPMATSFMPATQIDARRYLFDALGAPRQLVNRPEPESSIASISEPRHLPGAISRRALHADLAGFAARAFAIFVDGTALAPDEMEACDLSDDGAGWNHAPHPAREPGDPPQRVRVDPELGRISFPTDQAGEIRVSYHTAFPARIGGGEYNRAADLTVDPGQIVVRVPTDQPTIQAAIAAVRPTGGVVEIVDNDVYAGDIALSAEPDTELVLRAADGRRPILRIGAPLRVEGGANARIILDGLTVEGNRVNIRPTAGGASLSKVTIRHSTLIPGRGFSAAGGPATPGATSLTVTTIGLELLLDRVITGQIRMDDTTNAEIRDSIVDAAAADPARSPEGRAILGVASATSPAGALTIHASTIIGRVAARVFPVVSDTILLARSPGAEPPVRAMRRQEGCMRFSFVPHGSVTPRRYRCQPQLSIDQAVAAAEDAAGGPIGPAARAVIIGRITRSMRPGFTALSASHPAYARLRRSTPLEIRAGASDEGEMGAYHLVHAPQRETNLRIRLEEYLRFGLEAGLFYET